VAAESLSGSDGEMVVSYGVTIVGIQRTKADLAKVSMAINSLRKTEYVKGATVMGARFGTDRSDVIAGRNRSNTGRDIYNGNDPLSGEIDVLEGNIQSAAEKAMAKAMALGKRTQAQTLRAATTPTGESGKSHTKGGRKGPGREDTGAMINALATNVETQKAGASLTKILGWHGWPKERPEYLTYQEQGTKGRKSAQVKASVNRKVQKRAKGTRGTGIQAVNSLGAAIVSVRENLKTELGKMKK
jgi:hypothetical protein